MKIGPGTVALITGGSSGIGLAAAHAFARKGARLALVARRRGPLEDAAIEIPGAIALAADISKEEEAERVVAETVARFGRLDVLINNAGMLLYKPMADCSMDEIRQLIDLNFFAQAYCSRAAIMVMRKQGQGHIVNVSSLAGRIGFPYLGYYSASKFALTGFSEALRQEVKPDGICVSLVHPGTVETAMTRQILDQARKKGKRVVAIQAAQAARAILCAVEQEKAEAFVPWAGKMLYYAHCVFPRAAEWIAWKFRAAEPAG